MVLERALARCSQRPFPPLESVQGVNILYLYFSKDRLSMEAIAARVSVVGSCVLLFLLLDIGRHMG